MRPGQFSTRWPRANRQTTCDKKYRLSSPKPLSRSSNKPNARKASTRLTRHLITSRTALLSTKKPSPSNNKNHHQRTLWRFWSPRAVTTTTSKVSNTPTHKSKTSTLNKILTSTSNLKSNPKNTKSEYSSHNASHSQNSTKTSSSARMISACTKMTLHSRSKRLPTGMVRLPWRQVCVRMSFKRSYNKMIKYPTSIVGLWNRSVFMYYVSIHRIKVSILWSQETDSSWES